MCLFSTISVPACICSYTGEGKRLVLTKSKLLKRFWMPLMKYRDEGVQRDSGWRGFSLLSKIRPPKPGPEGKLAFVLSELGIRRGHPQRLLHHLALSFPQTDQLGAGRVGDLFWPAEGRGSVVRTGPGSCHVKAPTLPPGLLLPPVLSPCQGHMWGIQSPFSSKEFCVCEILRFTIYLEAPELTRCFFPPCRHENFDWIMNGSWWRAEKKGNWQ